MKKLTSVILSLLLVLVLVTTFGAKSSVVAQAEESQTAPVVCDPSEKIAWAWGLLDIEEADAPAFIYFFWPDGSDEQASLYAYDPVKKIAYYRTTNNLNIEPEGWGSSEVSNEQLADLYYQCPAPTVTSNPTVTTDPSETVTPSVTTEVTVSVSPSVTVTEEVTPSVEITTSVTPAEEVTRGEESPTPTSSESNEEEAECTPTPTSANSENSSVGGTSNFVPAATSPVAASAPSTVQVLGATTMAKTGSLDQIVMNLAGIFGMLFTTAGSLIYVKKRKNKIAA